jgi:predicted nucleotide-binding protein (sugar kinase/HSP70/actin superfamily)
MIISWPHMGSLEVILGGVFEELKLDYILPPPNSQRTLELGARYGPEFACFPLKTTLGNFIEAIEAGADTLIMVAGQGPCRFGYYAETQRRILKDAGYDFQMVPLEFQPGKLPFLV